MFKLWVLGSSHRRPIFSRHGVAMNTSYEFFAHTADTGIRAHGPQLQDVLTGLADGLKELVAEDSQIEPREARPVRLEADDAASLVLAWLQQLLFWFSTGRFLPGAY